MAINPSLFFIFVNKTTIIWEGGLMWLIFFLIFIIFVNNGRRLLFCERENLDLKLWFINNTKTNWICTTNKLSFEMANFFLYFIKKTAIWAGGLEWLIFFVNFIIFVIMEEGCYFLKEKTSISNCDLLIILILIEYLQLISRHLR